MQFTCPAERLIEGLQIATRALAAKTPNPILEGVLVETEEDAVVLTCSDERITIVTRIDAEFPSGAAASCRASCLTKSSAA